MPAPPIDPAVILLQPNTPAFQVKALEPLLQVDKLKPYKLEPERLVEKSEVVVALVPVAVLKVRF